VADVALIQRFLPSRSRGGVGVFTDGLARALVKRGHHVTIVSQDPAPADAPYRVVPVVMPQHGWAAWWSPLTFPFALRRCDWSSFDVIHAQGDEQWIPHTGRPPIVRTMHGTALAEAWFNGVKGGSVKRLLLHLVFYLSEVVAAWRADIVAGVSRHTLKCYPGRHVVIPNGIDVQALAPDGTAKSAHPTVLFIGEAASRKRGTLLMQVMHDEVRRQIPDAELWMVGPDAVSAPGRVAFGSVDDGTLGRLLRSAWVMCLPSAYEGFGRPYVEAMAAGTTVVATPNAGAREVLEDGRYGVLTPDASLGAALVRILRSPEERLDYETRARAYVARFDWDVVAAAYEQIYADVIASRKSSTRA
jgi:glycosyltransferase involved in cell wall biosynthesis